MATQAQMELQASVRMTALENIDMQRDLLNWENQMKSEEKRTKIPRENSDPSTSADQSRAEIYKTEGNKYYTSGDYNKAITYYSKAIGADRNGKLSGILYTNRAQCQFKLGNLEECLIDCNETLRIAPLNEKAIFRRMEANYQAKNLQMAEKDCKQLLEINPKHTAGLSFQSRLKIELENNLKNTLNNGTSYTSTIDGIGKDLQFVKIPPHKQPNSTLKRIRITSNNIEGNSQAVAVERSAPIHKIDFPKEDLNNNEKKEIAQNNSPKWSTIDSVGIDISFIEKPDAEKKTDLKTIPIEGTKTLLDPKVTKNQENNAIKSDGPAIPLTSAAFFKNWKNFKEPSERFAWLKNISSVGFNDLLGSNLDSSLLSELLIVFCEYFVPNRIPVLPYLREIAKSDQLAILSLMMSKADQEALTTLLEFTRKLNEKELDYIAKQFSF